MTEQQFIEQFDGAIAIGGSSGLAANAVMSFRRGTAEQAATYVGRLNEMVYSTDDKVFHLHDGETPGGVLHLKLAAG